MLQTSMKFRVIYILPDTVVWRLSSVGRGALLYRIHLESIIFPVRRSVNSSDASQVQQEHQQKTSENLSV